MEISLFFNPVEESITGITKDQHSFLQAIYVNTGKFPDLNGIELAIVGLEEGRGNKFSERIKDAPNVVRRKLYSLKKGTGRYKVADLGNLKNGETREDTIDRLKEVCFMLLEANVVPVILGGTHDLDLGQYRGYDGLDKMVTLLNVDARLDIDDPDPERMYASHIQKIFLHEPNYLFNYVHVGYQSYLIEPNAINVLERLFFESYRLGQIRENFRNIEPILRDADLLSFDTSAVKSSDLFATNNPVPFGLTGEEACQICWYAGLNEKLSSAGFYEYDPSMDDDAQSSAFVLATMIWYFIEGVCHRKHDSNLKVNDYVKFLVSMPTEQESITFFKSTKSERWWMEVPHPNNQLKYHRSRIVPCSYSDYETATRGEVPQRWISTFNKMI